MDVDYEDFSGVSDNVSSFGKLLPDIPEGREKHSEESYIIGPDLQNVDSAKPYYEIFSPKIWIKGHRNVEEF